MVYEEAPSAAVPGAVLWRAAARTDAVVLPDGCMDLLWADGRLLVAAPTPGRIRPGRSPAAPSRGSGSRPAPRPR